MGRAECLGTGLRLRGRRPRDERVWEIFDESDKCKMGCLKDKKAVFPDFLLSHKVGICANRAEICKDMPT